MKIYPVDVSSAEFRETVALIESLSPPEKLALFVRVSTLAAVRMRSLLALPVGAGGVPASRAKKRRK